MSVYEIPNLIGWPTTIVAFLVSALLLAVFVPKGFMRISPEVRNIERASKIHRGVVTSLAYKYERTGRGFGEKEEYMYWTEYLPDGNWKKWRAWAKEGLMFDLELVSTTKGDGVRKSATRASNNYQG